MRRDGKRRRRAKAFLYRCLLNNFKKISNHFFLRRTFLILD